MIPTERASGATYTAVDLYFESVRVDACVQERLTNCPNAHYFNRVSTYYVRGTFTLEVQYVRLFESIQIRPVFNCFTGSGTDSGLDCVRIVDGMPASP